MNTGEINSTNVTDYDPSKVKVVVGLSNKIDSFVTAYLLKKQKFNVIGITVINWQPKKDDDEDEEDKPQPLDLGLGGDDKAQKVDVEFDAPRCSIQDTSEIENFCRWLDIPFYIADASSEYERHIVDRAVKRRVEGRYFQSCLECHLYRIRTLFTKAKKIGAHLIATGHFAKVHLNKSFNQHFIYKANDQQHDQSFMLAGLSDEILNKLLLPLGDIQKSEVLKLAEMNIKPTLDGGFYADSIKDAKVMNEFQHCITNDPKVVTFVEQNITQEFWQPVSLVNQVAQVNEGDFAGRFCLPYGALKSNFTEDRITDKNRILAFKHEKALFGTPETFKTNFFSLYKLNIMDNVSHLKPFKCFIKKEAHKIIPVTLYFKSAGRALIEAEVAQCFHPDEKIAIYDSDSKLSKIIGSGFVSDRVESYWEDRFEEYKDDYATPTEKDIYEGF